MRESSFPIVVEIKGERFELPTEEMQEFNAISGDGNSFTVQDQNEEYIIRVIDFDLASGRCTVSINGQTIDMKIIRPIEIMIEKMGLNASHAKTHSLLTSPMPGLVTNIKTEVNQKVEKGMPLLILEAMKMENVIAAPHDAVIKNICVTIGQAVDRGVVLIEFE